MLDIGEALLKDDDQDQYLIDNSKLPLSQLIPKIVAERGRFEDLKEDELIDEILENHQQPANDTTVQEEDQEDSESFMKQKMEVITAVQTALNESSLLLDLVSLLISCTRPAAGSTSMSPHLKQHAKLGSLNCDDISSNGEVSRLAEENKEKHSIVGLGWKSDALDVASKRLLSASERLNDEVLKEKMYWDNILETLEANEVILKLNSKGGLSNSKEIGVKYGFGDSGSTYFDRGIAILKKGRSFGEIHFNRINNLQVDRDEKVVKVSILSKVDDEYTLTGKSNSRKYLDSLKNFQINHTSIVGEIERARFFIFEEEFFHQLLKEATELISYQVQVDGNKIVVDLGEEIIEIESVLAETQLDDNQVPHKELSHNQRADYITIFLRLMLCAHFRSNLENKRHNPTALTVHPPGTPKQKVQLNLLRPLIGNYRHNKHLQLLKNIIEMLIRNIYLDDEKVSEIMGQHFKLTKHLAEPKSQQNQDPFIRCKTPPVSEFLLELPSRSGEFTLKVIITVSATSSFCGLQVRLKMFKILEKDSEMVLDVTFSDVRDVQDCLSWSWNRYL
ncbi:hypothetical protein LJB42_004295 [Komagataella kurtzmanii]|nr:hypothetical protein LJB42_004295 [Komagataella kurtzmanii]